MLDTYKDEDIETIKLIYEICAKELTRQVTVNCLERGELLQILFNYQPEIYRQKLNCINEEIIELKEQHKKDISDIYANNINTIKNLEEKIKEGMHACNLYKLDKDKAVAELMALKQKFSDNLRRFSEEEKVWIQKNYFLFQKLRSRHTSINKNTHPLAGIN